MSIELHTSICSEKNSFENAPWETLPDELLEQILDLVGDPTLTAKVNKDFYTRSTHAYTVLLKHHAGNPSLTDLIPLLASKFELTPFQKVQMIYLTITKDVKNCRIDLGMLEPKLPPLAPSRLIQIRKLTHNRLRDKAFFYRAAFYELAQNLGRNLTKKTTREVIQFAENSLENLSEILEVASVLDLKNLGLTHLPAQMEYLKGLVKLNLLNNRLTLLPTEMKSLTRLNILDLRQNPLSPENVKEICNCLPNLETVFIDSQQRALARMFQNDFPQLNLGITQILTEEDPI